MLLTYYPRKTIIPSYVKYVISEKTNDCPLYNISKEGYSNRLSKPIK